VSSCPNPATRGPRDHALRVAACHPSLGRTQVHLIPYKPGGAESFVLIEATAEAMDAEAEGRGHAKELCEALTCEKDYVLFTHAKAAPMHVRTRSLYLSGQRVFGRLAEMPARVRAAK
jgi:hypothetical protein